MNNRLYLLWTTRDKLTAENMVLMYAKNSLRKGWWDGVTVIIWGAAQLLVTGDPDVQAELTEAQELGVRFSACIACAMKLGTAAALTELGVEVISWGEKLTALIRSGEPVLSV